VVGRSAAGSSGVVVSGALWSGEMRQEVAGLSLQVHCSREKYG
jgi:hypothetical protein